MIRPIEMQMLLPRTESVATSQHHENQQVVNANTHAAGEAAKEAKHNSETVIKKDANQFAEYQYDAKEEGNGTYQNPRKRRNKKQDTQEEESLSNNEDIFIPDNQPRINIQL